MKLHLIALFLLLHQLAWSQVSVTGRVTGAADGEPLTGVTIKIIGSPGGATTDLDGRYRISVPSTASVLEFVYTGMLNRSETVGNRTVIDVLIERPNVSLSERFTIASKSSL